MQKIRLQYAIYICLLLVACNNDVVYTEWHNFENDAWHKDDLITFTYHHTNTDVTTPYNIIIELRNTKDYMFSNLYLRTQIFNKGESIITDTLEYNITDTFGHFLGTGITSVKNNKLLYKENFLFQDTGYYDFKLEHMMRRLGEVNGIQNLKGINAIGITIESINGRSI